MSAAAVKCGLAPDGPTGRGSAHLDLDEARKLITALAALVTASAPDIGNQHARVPARRAALAPARVPRGLRLPRRTRRGPGEKFTGSVV